MNKLFCILACVGLFVGCSNNNLTCFGLFVGCSNNNYPDGSSFEEQALFDINESFRKNGSNTRAKQIKSFFIEENRSELIPVTFSSDIATHRCVYTVFSKKFSCVY